MVRRFYLWFWPYFILILLAFLANKSIDLWHFLSLHLAFLQPFDQDFVTIWTATTHFLWHLVWITTCLLVIWYIWDWIRGYALLDFFAYRLRNFLLRSTSNNTDETFDVIAQKQANRAIRSIKLRFNWSKRHNVIVLIHLPSNQNTARIIRDRVVNGLGDDEITVISWLNRCQWWPLSSRHWELDQNNQRYLKIVGMKG